MPGDRLTLTGPPPVAPRSYPPERKAKEERDLRSWASAWAPLVVAIVGTGGIASLRGNASADALAALREEVSALREDVRAKHAAHEVEIELLRRQAADARHQARLREVAAASYLTQPTPDPEAALRVLGE